jgi:tRNA pseudouridine55 synthase
VAIPRALEPSGLVLVDKPVGPSSFQVVRRLRTRTGAKAGHAGTLDPFASGLLLVLLGASTRLARYLVSLDKRYLSEIDLCRRTSSGDIEGEPIEEHDAPEPAQLERLLEGFRGEVELLVPAFSALKIGGERAYRLARQGKAPEMPLRRSRIEELKLLDYSGGVARLDLSVGSGTYVRAIADALGGHCRTLRRLEVGPFSVEQADDKRVLPPAQALSFLPALELSEEEAAAVRAGRALERDGEGQLLLLYSGNLIGVGHGVDGTVRSETMMPT